MLAELSAKKGAMCHPFDEAAYNDVKHASAMTQVVARYITLVACRFANENQHVKLDRVQVEKDKGDGISAWVQGTHPPISLNISMPFDAGVVSGRVYIQWKGRRVAIHGKSTATSCFRWAGSSFV